jgi:hypothetical protein
MRRIQLLPPTAIGLLVLFATLATSAPVVAGPIIRHRYVDRSSERFGSVIIRNRLVDQSATPVAAQATPSTSQPKHDPVTLLPAARLVLYVSDDAEVAINGRRMKPQYLAGRHRETRQYLLAGFLNKPEILSYEVRATWRDKHGHHLATIWLAPIKTKSGETEYRRIATPYAAIARARHDWRAAQAAKHYARQAKRALAEAQGAANLADEYRQAAEKERKAAEAAATKAATSAKQAATAAKQAAAVAKKVAEAKKRDAGLLVRYRFDEGLGNVIHDTAPENDPLHLIIDGGRDDYDWDNNKNGLKIKRPLVISSAKSAQRLVHRIKASNAFTIEAWINPKETTTVSPGPARIVSVSSDTGNRNVTLGQQDLKYVVRLRTDDQGIDANGLKGGQPPLSSPNAAALPEWTHVVITRDSDGTTKLYVNGNKVSEEKILGKLSTWDEKMHLHLANEQGKDRKWLGTYRYVAVYDRALTGEEVKWNYGAKR